MSVQNSVEKEFGCECSSCVEDRLEFTCGACREACAELYIANVGREDEQGRCDECSHATFECNDCGNRYFADSVETCYVRRGAVCEFCLEQNYFTCDDCGESCSNEDRVDGDLCCDCQSGHDADDESSEGEGDDFSLDEDETTGYQHMDSGDVEDCSLVRECNARAEDIFDHSMYDGQLLFGVELETIANVDGRDTAARLKKLVGDFCILKRDGSLKGFGIEIVSGPLPFEVHLQKWGALFDRPPHGLRSWKTIDACCGMHIHVTRSMLTTLQIGKANIFLNHINNRPFVTGVAGRSGNGYCSYNADTKLYTHTEHTSRYSVLNARRNTIEFRIFRGTLKRTSFFKNLEFIHAILMWANQAGVDSLTHADFVGWLAQNAAPYTNLINFIKQKNLPSANLLPSQEISTLPAEKPPVVQPRDTSGRFIGYLTTYLPTELTAVSA